jgi:ATP-dependent Lon protease
LGYLEENDIIQYIIETYTLEPGVRKLKEIFFDFFGQINLEILGGEHDAGLPLVFDTVEKVESKYLTKFNKIHEKKIGKGGKVGVVNGLWANSYGRGGILHIETMFYPCSKGMELKLTGLQGDVMKESMNVAKTLALSLTGGENLTQGIHIHCPEGAVQKDGPSAGAAITTAIYSLLNKKIVLNHVAMTGEINLQGEVTAIGGLENKFIGGIRAGVTTFLYPESNRNDYEKFVEKYEKHLDLGGIRFVSVGTIEDVFSEAFATDF